MKKKTNSIQTPFGNVLPPCAACKKNELRDLVYAILDALPVDLVTEYAQEKLELMSFDEALEAAADRAEVMREGYCDR